jgi:hypothetical protein
MSTAKQRKKWREDKRRRVKEKREQGNKKPRFQRGPTRDAIVYLRHARNAIKVEIVTGRGSLDDPAYLFAMLALSALEGGGA